MSAKRILDGEAAAEALDATRREASERGGFLVMLHDQETDAFEPKPAVFTAEIEDGNTTALCLTIGQQQWLMRADELIAGIRHAFMKAVQAGPKTDLPEVSESSTPVSSDTGPWIATFRDGPMAGHKHDRVFTAGPIRAELIFMPDPRWYADAWILVGLDGLESDEPWPGEVRYRFDTVVRGGVVGEYELVAYYRLVKEASNVEPEEQR